MRVLVLTDESFAARERAMLSRLEVGLADDGVRVIHGVPRRSLGWHQQEVFAHPVIYQSRGLVISRAWRAKQVMQELEAISDAGDKPVDVVHCFGRGCWAMGMELADLTGAALAMELWSAELTSQTGRVRVGDSHSPVYFVADAALERAVRTQDPNLPVRLTPWGVHTPGQPLEILKKDKSVSIMIAGSGRDPVALNAALEGLSTVVERHPDLMVFADAGAVKAAAVWTTVRKLGLLSRFTLIPDMEARRELALRGDILMLPESRGEQRSITLDAMAHGMLVIAADDPLCSVLIDGRTARVVEKPTADRWSAALGWALDDREQARSLAFGGREYVRLNRRASSHVSSVVDSYEWMTAKEAIPFVAT